MNNIKLTILLLFTGLLLVSCSTPTVQIEQATLVPLSPSSTTDDEGEEVIETQIDPIQIVELTDTPEPTAPSDPVEKFSEIKPINPGDPQPISSEVIGINNIQDIELLSTWGKGELADMAFSPIEDVLVVATRIGLWIYDIKNLDQPQFLPTEAPINDIVYSRDGELLAALVNRDRIKIFNKDLILINEIKLDSNSFGPIEFTDNDEILVADRCDVQVVNLKTNEISYRFDLHEETEDATICDNDKFHSISVSPDGNRLVVGSEYNVVMIWDINTGELINSVSDSESNYDSEFATAMYSPDGKYIFTQSYYGGINLRNAITLELVKTLDSSPNYPDFFNFTIVNNEKIIAFAENNILFFDYPSLTYTGMEKINDFDIGTPYSPYVVPQHTAVNKNGKYAAFIDRRNEIVFLQTDPITELYRAPGYFWGFDSIAPIEGTPYFAFAIWDAIIDPQTHEPIYGWDFNTMTVYPNLSGHEAYQILYGDLKSGCLIIPSVSGAIKYTADTIEYINCNWWDPNNSAHIHQAVNIVVGEIGDYYENITLSPDVHLIAGPEGIWDVETGEKITETDCVNMPMFSSDVRWLSCFTSENSLLLIDIENNFDAQILENEQSETIEGFKFSPNSKLLGTASDHSNFTLWDLESKSILWTENYAESKESWNYYLYWYIEDFLFSPDSEVVFLSTGNESLIQALSVQSGKKIIDLYGHTDDGKNLFFSEDGKTLISISRDGTLRTWGIP